MKMPWFVFIYCLKLPFQIKHTIGLNKPNYKVFKVLQRTQSTASFLSCVQGLYGEKKFQWILTGILKTDIAKMINLTLKDLSTGQCQAKGCGYSSHF